MSLINFSRAACCIFFLAFSSFVLSAQDLFIDCTLDDLQLEASLPAQIFIQSVDIQAEYKVDKDELLYLVDIPPMTHISLQDITKTIFYLRKKECFSKIEVCYQQKNSKLIFKLDGFFILSNLRLHGSMIGKEKYRTAYIMETGECFDKKKHDYSLQKIKEIFFNAGYFNVKIRDEISYNSLLKTVKVDLYFTKGLQFSFGNCSFDMNSEKPASSKNLDLIVEQLHHIFIKNFFTLRYTKDLLEKSIIKFKKYLNKHGFSQAIIEYEEVINSENRQIDLKFNLAFEEQKEFIFWGNHFFTQENFLENILMYGKSSWQFPSAILSDEIESIYKSKGFWDMKLSVKEELGKVYCVINEGKRAMIKEIEFKDNFHISSKTLCQECFASVQDKLFDRAVFSKSVHALKQFYMHHGYWGIKVVKEEFIPLAKTFNEKAVEHKTVLTVDEGSKKYLKSIDIKDYPDLLKKKPFVQFAQMLEPIPFDYSLISVQKNWLISYFQDLGFTKILVNYELIEADDGTILSWTIKVDEKQIHFGKLLVSGNSQIPFKYLKRELQFKEGEIWDKKKIEQSIETLRRLELFDTVYVYSHKELDDLGQVPVGLKLIEADKYEIRTRIGGQQVGKDFSLQQGFSYKAGGTFILNNPFKFGDRLITEVDFTRFYGNFSLQYLMPWIFNRPIRSQIKVYDNSYLQPLYIGSDVSIYSAYQQGILFGLQEKHEHFNIGMGIGLEFKGVQSADIKDIEKSLDCNPELFHKKFAYFFTEPSLMWNYVDNLMNPKNGWNAYLSFLSMVDLTGQNTLFKFIAEHASYISLNSATTFAIRTRIGHIFNQEYINILPIDRFNLGGANTVRGYNRDYCQPLGLLSEEVYAPNSGLPPAANNMWHYVNQGGRTMINFNFEVRFPIYYQLEGATFFDAGVLIKDSMNEVADNMLGGTGFGFRYNTPIGALRFDFAFKLDRKYPLFESAYIWYLTLGQAF